MLIQNAYDGFCGKIYAFDEKPKESEITWLVRKAAEEGAPVCELACGTGRLTIPLAEHGFEVVGMDLSETLIEIANNKLKGLPAEVAQKARFVQGDLRQFDLGQRFPFIFIFFGGFGHLTEPEDHRSSLNCIREHLEPNGLLEIECTAPSAPKEYFEEPRIISEERSLLNAEDVKCLGLSYQNPIERTSRVSVWWVDAKRLCCKTEIWVRHKDSKEEYHEGQWAGWFFTLGEISDLMSECGFKVERIFGAHEYPLRPPEPGDAVWIVDARPA